MAEKEKRWAFMSRKVIGRPDNPMLVRWRLIQTPWFGIYLHIIWREDLDRLPHDHPWSFRSWVVRGGYIEEFWPDIRLMGHSEVRAFGQIGRIKGWVSKPQWTHRFRPTEAHRITFVLPHTTTLVVVGRKFRTWGFYDGGNNFIEWTDYHKVAPQYVGNKLVNGVRS